MNSNKKTKLKYLLAISCIALFSLAGYFYVSLSPMEEKRENTWEESGFLKIGHNLTIQNTDNRLSLLDDKDVLSASGLYYAAWTMGSPEPYENSEKELVDLYDAQLYLVLGEYKSAEEALKNMTKWLDAGKKNYEILAEEKIVCNGQPYSLITYNCISEENPYERGVSAFGTCGADAVCIELACKKEFEEDLREILVRFLDSCAYGAG